MLELLQAILEKAQIDEKIETIQLLAGGKNNRVYLLSTGKDKYVGKHYFSDRHDRQHQEASFLRYCADVEIYNVPSLIYEDKESNISLLSHLQGGLITRQELKRSHIEEAREFLSKLQSKPQPLKLPKAIDCCFRKEEHIEQTRWRLRRLQNSPRETALEKEMHSFVSVLDKIFLESSEKISPDYLQTECASPSDFGFHNALISKEKTYFIDFEYAGRDSLQKLLCDFFCQPRIPVSIDYLPSFCSTMSRSNSAMLEANIRELLPIYRIKWCTILLNEFTANKKRRDFALRQDGNRAQLQLEKARAYQETFL